MSPATIKIVLTVFALFAVIIVAAYDVYAIVSHKQTVSHMILEFAREYPIFAVAIGSVLGHLFWPLSK